MVERSRTGIERRQTPGGCGRIQGGAPRTAPWVAAITVALVSGLLGLVARAPLVGQHRARSTSPPVAATSALWVESLVAHDVPRPADVRLRSSGWVAWAVVRVVGADAASAAGRRPAPSQS